MATELLQRTVLPHLEEYSLRHTLLDDSIIQVWLRHEEACFEVFTIDHEISDHPLLQIRFRDFVRFLDTQEAYAIDMCNKLNVRVPGKFVLDGDGDLSYQLDCPAGKNSGPDDFKGMMVLALSSLMQAFPIVMMVRWANASVEQAIKRLKDGGAGTHILSSEDIMELLNRDSSEQEDPEYREK